MSLRSLIGLGAAVILAAAGTAALRVPDRVVRFDASLPAPAISDSDIEARNGCTIHFTLDGSVPDERSPIYSGQRFRPNEHAIGRLIATPTSLQWRHPEGSFDQAAVVRACYCDAQGGCGPISTRTILPAPVVRGLDVISIVLPEGALMNDDTGIYVVGHGIFHDDEIAVQRYPRDQRWWKYPGNFQFRGSEWERSAHMEWLHEGEQQWGEDVALRIHGNNTRGFPQHALRVTFQGRSPVILGGKHRSIVLRASGNDQDRAFMRDVVQHRLCADLGFETSGSQPVAVFINGAYWGIHDVRERLDADELAIRHHIKKSKFTVLEDRCLLDHGDSAEIAGFWKLVNQAERWDPHAAGYADSIAVRVDVGNFLRYMAAQVILGNSDWPDQNVKFWRYTGRADSAGVKDGRWRFIMGDSDMGLGFNGGPEVDILGHIAVKRGPVARLFNACMRNPRLKERFRGTVLELLEGPLSASTMSAAIEAQRGLIREEMFTHIQRWRRPLDMDRWNERVEELLTFARRRPDIVRAQLQRHFPTAL